MGLGLRFGICMQRLSGYLYIQRNRPESEMPIIHDIYGINNYETRDVAD